MDYGMWCQTQQEQSDGLQIPSRDPAASPISCRNSVRALLNIPSKKRLHGSYPYPHQEPHDEAADHQDH